MAFGYAPGSAYELQTLANQREDSARAKLAAQTAYYNQLSGQQASFGPGTNSGFSGGSTVTRAGSGSALPSVNGGTSGSVPAGPASMPTAPSVNASSNLQSVSEQLRYDPWAAYRDDAGNLLASKMGQTSPSDLYLSKLNQMATGEFTPDDPSYAWRYQQGQQAVERSLAAKGLLNSGNAAIELQQYGQGAASQEYQAQFSRMLQGLTGTENAYNQQMTRLMEMAGVNMNPVAGGQLNVAQEQVGVDRGRLALGSQELANQYDLGYRKLTNDSAALSSGQYSAMWNNLFSGGGGGSTAPTASWDEYFAAKDAATAAAQRAGTFTGAYDSSGNAIFRG